MSESLGLITIIIITTTFFKIIMIIIQCISKLSGPVGGDLIASLVNSVVKAGSMSRVDGVSSCKANEERLTRASLALFDFALSRRSTAASSAVELKAEQ